MDDRLKELMQELGNAINESLSDSERIAARSVRSKQAGYDVFLVLEATIGFNKRDENKTRKTNRGKSIRGSGVSNRQQDQMDLAGSQVLRVRSKSLSTKRSEISDIIRAVPDRLTRFFRSRSQLKSFARANPRAT